MYAGTQNPENGIFIFFLSFGGKFSCAEKGWCEETESFYGTFSVGWKEGKHQDTQSSCGCDERNFIEANFNIVFYEGKSLLLCVSFSLSLFEYLLVYFLSLRRRRKVYQCKSLLFISRPRQELFSFAMKIWILAGKWWLWVVDGSCLLSVMKVQNCRNHLRDCLH